MSQPPFRILFVCMGNICRSPAAENIFRHHAGLAGRDLHFHIDSAGTIDYHQGAPPDPRMVRTLTAKGYPAIGSARHIRPGDLDEYDLILTMDDDNLAEVRRLDPTGRHHAKIIPFVQYCASGGATHVPDPYYGGQSGFDQVIELLENASRGLLATLPAPPSSTGTP